MGQRALARCRLLFSMEAYISRLESYYRNLAGRNKAARSMRMES